MATQPSHNLGPSFSIQDGAPVFDIGEWVLVRVPEAIQVGGYVEDEATAISDLPPTSLGLSPQHAAFVRQVNVHSDTSYMLEVYAVVSFSRSGGALAGYNQMDDATKATLLPLPLLSLRHPTPEAFGPLLDFGNWSTPRDSWLSIIPRRVIIPTSRPFKRMDPPLIMPISLLHRIDRYRGDYVSGVTSITSSPTSTAGAGQDQFYVDPPHGYLVLEGVDEDAEGADATMLDELIMLARDDPIWREELKKHLQIKEKERAQMQKEREARLAWWREGLNAQST